MATADLAEEKWTSEEVYLYPKTIGTMKLTHLPTGDFEYSFTSGDADDYPVTQVGIIRWSEDGTTILENRREMNTFGPGEYDLASTKTKVTITKGQYAAYWNTTLEDDVPVHHLRMHTIRMTFNERIPNFPRHFYSGGSNTDHRHLPDGVEWIKPIPDFSNEEWIEKVMGTNLSRKREQLKAFRMKRKMMREDYNALDREVSDIKLQMKEMDREITGLNHKIASWEKICAQ